MQAPNVNLFPGSTDVTNVKKLQDYLVSLGLMTQAEVDTGYGIYGPKTTRAVAALQRLKGVDTSAGGAGNFGPKTIQAVTIPSPATNPAIETKPTTPPSGQAPAGDGSYNFGNGERLTQEVMDKLVQQNYDEQSPFYQAQQNYELGGFQNTEDSLLNSYDLTARDYAARAQEDYDALNDNEGKSGTWASSERAKRRSSLENKYNRSYESLYNTNVDNLYKNRLDRAYQYGDANVGSNRALNRYGTSFGDTNTNQTTLGGGGTYNPFGFQGRRNVERKQNAKLGATNYLETFTFKNNIK